MNSKKSHYINGKWLLGSGTEITSIDPATGQQLWQGFEATIEETSQAIQSAKKAFVSWGNLDVDIRIKYLKGFADILTKNKEALAEAISKETGKPLWEALTEVQAMVNKVPISLEAYHVRYPNLVKDIPAGKNITRPHPHGALAILGPFNFPGHLPNGHIIPALLAGNTIIFKPSELTPQVGQLMIELWEQTSLPPGVLNMIQGGPNVGQLLSNNHEIDGLLFTGSWNTGKRIAQRFASTPNRILALEMGGNNPLIVSNVSNIKAAAYTTIQSAFITSGQRCTCARRLIVIDDQYGKEFIKTLVEMTKTIQVGPYTNKPEPFMGPVISAKAAENILAKQEHWLSQGAEDLVKATQLPLGKAFISPGIIDVTKLTERVDEEVFGPLLQLIRVANFQEALTEANNTKYGLATGLLSDSDKEYYTLLAQAKAGVINWNSSLTGACSGAPFGGIGQSGNNRPGGFYAADYCAYPVASTEASLVSLPMVLHPGITL